MKSKLAGNAAVLIALLAILCAGFTLRYALFVMTGGLGPDYLTWANAHYFGGIAQQYLQGIGVLLNGTPWMSIRPPGYSFVLLIFTGLGADNSQELRLYQAAADCLTCVLLFYIAIRLTGSRVAGLFAAAVYALTPVFAMNSVTLLAEAMAPLLMASLLALMLYARNGPAWRWLALGVCAGFALLVRSDFLLFAAFIVVWWFFTARSRTAIAALLIGIVLPSLIWFSYSHLRAGYYSSASASGYALWSGLGQFPNNHGYTANDVRAAETLVKRGSTQMYPEADPYWMEEYRKAWKQHPEYVLGTIWTRVKWIPVSQTAPPHDFVIWTSRYFTEYGHWVLIASVVLLVCLRKFAAAFIVALPLSYALMTLGLVYFEERYARYLVLSYILAPVVALGFVPWRNVFYAALAVAFMVDIYGAMPGLQARTARKIAEATIVAKANAGTTRVIAGIGDLKWIPTSPEVRYTADERGLHLTADSRPSSYQLAAILPDGKIHVDYEASLDDGPLGIGILSRDRSEFVSISTIANKGENRGRLVSADGGMLMIYNARAGAGESRVTFGKIEVRTAD